MTKEIKGYDYFTNERTGKIMAVSHNTGEVTEAVTFLAPINTISYTPEQQEAYKERQVKKQQRYFNKKDKAQYTFVSVAEKFNGISAANLTRLIYLSTYLTYHNNELRITERRKMCKSELPAVLGVSQSTADRFWNEVNPRYIYEDKNGVLKLNSKIFVRGKMKGLNDYYIKVFAKGMSDLYCSVPKSKHRQLGYVFKILPYVNIEHNILCYNTFETDLNRIESMSMKEFCEKIGFDYRHVDRLHKSFRNLTFDVGDGKRELFFSIIKDGYTGKKLMIVNPRVFYSGNNAKAVSEFGEFYS